MAKASLHELMGKSGGKDLTLDHLGELLGERMPKIEYTPIGRMRLTTALRNRFGDSYRNLPGIEGILKEFDDHAAFNVKLQEMKMIGRK
jgi:hypothetical protein